MLSIILNYFNNYGLTKNITLNKFGDNITLSISGIYNTYPDVITLPILDNLKLTSVNKSGLTTILTYSKDVRTNDEVLFSNIIFKVVDKELFEFISQNDHINDYIVNSSLNTPINDVIFKFCDTSQDPYFESCGFTPHEIFTSLGLNVIYPYSLDYTITELRINKGMSIVNLIRTIFPFVNLKIRKMFNTYYVELPQILTINVDDDNIFNNFTSIDNYIENEIVNTLENNLNGVLGVNFCITQKNTTIKKLKDIDNVLCRGFQSSPKNVIFSDKIIEHTQDTQNNIEKLQILNGLGKNFITIYEVSTIKSDTISF